MSLKPEGIRPVPEETARIARAAYPKGNVFMRMRDELGTIYEDESIARVIFPDGPASRSALAFSIGHHHAVGREPLRSASR
jgi:transposase